MANEQETIMQAIAQAVVKAARAMVQAMAVARTDNSDRMQSVVPKIGRLIMQQPIANWEAMINIANSKTSYARYTIYLNLITHYKQKE